MAQTSYDLDSAVALPGQVADLSNKVIVSYPAGGDIPFGAAVELQSDGTVIVPEDTTLTKLVGIAVRDDLLPQVIGGGSPGYEAGDMVPVLRVGKVYALFNGGTDAALTKAHVKHSSTTATYRGYITASAVSASAGSEITDFGGLMFVSNMSDSALCLVEVNLLGGVKTGPTGATGATGPTGPTGA